MTASATRLTAFAVLAAALVAGILWLSGRDDTAPPALPSHVPVAPGPQAASHGHGTVLGTQQDPQSVADAAIEGTTGPGGRRPDLSPLPERAFDAPIARYRVYAAGQARLMAREVGALTAALRVGDRAGARRAWAGAYERYLRIGAAYGALGDLDEAIDGRDTGLHAIERGLWTGASLSSLVPQSRRLARHVARLPQALGKGEITPLEYATRAHEILEDAQRDQVSGVAPAWSGAGVEATAADLAATRVVIGTLRPVLQGRGDALQQADTRLGSLGAVLARIHRAHHGTWPALSKLTVAEHEELTGSLGATLEALSAMPGSLETALPPVIPELK